MLDSAFEPDDDLSVEDRFLLQIALKNRILDPGQASRLEAEACATGEQLEAILLRLGILDERQLERLRGAMAASQIVRMDSLYAAILTEHRVVPPQILEQAFAEQRRQRFRVRVGKVLVDRGQLTPSAHRQVTSEVIRRLKLLGTEAYSSSIEKKVPRPAPAPSDAALPTPERPEPEPPKSHRQTRPVISIAETLDPDEPPGSSSGSGLFNRSSAIFLQQLDKFERTADDEDESFTLSAIRIGLDSQEAERFGRSDRTKLETFLEESGGPPEGDAGSFVLDRMDLASSGSSEFVPDAYLQRKRLKTHLTRAGVGGAVVLTLTLFVLMGINLIRSRAGLSAVRSLINQAEASPRPDERRRLYLAAHERLASMSRLAVGDDVLKELSEKVTWGALRAEARSLIAQDNPQDAYVLLERNADRIPESARKEHAALLLDAARVRHMLDGGRARSRGDLQAAVVAYQAARKIADPGRVASARLAEIREGLDQAMEAAYQRALATLSKQDETLFVAAAKDINDLFNDPPGATERVQELHFRRAVARGQELFERARFLEAQEVFEEAARLRPGERGVLLWIKRSERRQSQTTFEARGRRAEQGGEFEQAIQHYEQAKRSADTPDRLRLDAAISRCKQKLAKATSRRDRRKRRRECLDRLRASRIDDALELLEALDAEARDPLTTELLKLTRRLDSMVYVPPGEFIMGSKPARPAKAIEQPQRRVSLPGYFIGRTEVTNQQFAKFVDTGAVKPPSHWTYAVRQTNGAVHISYDRALANHPVINVSWADATAYARWRGGALPSEAQWEKAARGTDGRTYPWGERTPARAHVEVQPSRLRPYETVPVGVHGDDKSPYGAMDMAGNVNEWTADLLSAYPGAPKGVSAPSGRRTIRGGAYRWPYRDARCAARDSMDESYTSPTVGFRIVIEVPESIPPLR